MITAQGKVSLEQSDYMSAAGKSIILKLDIDDKGKVISSIKKIISRED